MTHFVDRTNVQESAELRDQSIVSEGSGNTGARPVGVATAVLRWPRNVLRRLYDWTIGWSRTRNAPYALSAIAFAESSFFPVPPDVVLVPMVASKRQMWFRYALICTAGSVLGALMGYLIGWVFYESVGQAIVNAYNLQRSMEVIGEKYSQNALLTIFTAGFTPIPFKVITIGAGLFNVSIPDLVAGSILGRAGRFFLVAGLLRVFGEKALGLIDRHFDRLALVFTVILIGGFIALKYLR